MRTPSRKSVKEWSEPKPKQPTAKHQLQKDLHKFVDEILAHCECPSLWPLTPQEQSSFVRKVIYQANNLRNTEAYLAEAVELAAEDLAMAT